MLPRAVAAATSALPASVAASASSDRVTRLPCTGTVQAVCCLPRAPLAGAGGAGALSFGAGLSSAVGGASSSSSGLEANLHAVQATAHGQNNAVLSLRSLLTPVQVERLRRAQQEAAEDAADAAGGAVSPLTQLPVDAAPIVASHELKGCGGVSRLACLSDRLVVASTNLGEVVMVEVAQQQQQDDAFGASTPLQRRTRPAVAGGGALQLRPVHTFAALHGGACTGLAAHLSSSTPLLASVSDDGSLALLAPFSRQVVRRVAHAHPSALFSVAFGASGALHTAGVGGTISTFDLRAPSGGLTADGLAKPASLLFDANAVSLTSLAVHPTRAHLLAAGSSNGSLSIFDVRRSGVSAHAALPFAPVCSLQAQKAAVLDLAFVPWAPQQLLSCSDDGSLCCFHFGAAGGGDSASFDGDEAFTSAAAQSSMRPSKIVQNSTAIRAIALDRESRTLLAATDAPSMLSCQL